MVRLVTFGLLAVLLAACAQPASNEASLVPDAAALAESGRLRLLFDPGSTELSGEALEEIGDLGALMQRQPNLNIVMAAFAGTAAEDARMTRRLALVRLLTVRARLVGSGIKASRIHLRACGFRGDARRPDRIEAYVVAEAERAKEAKPCGPYDPVAPARPVTIAI